MAFLQARSDSVLVRILIVSVLCLDSRVEKTLLSDSDWFLLVFKQTFLFCAENRLVPDVCTFIKSNRSHA